MIETYIGNAAAAQGETIDESPVLFESVGKICVGVNEQKPPASDEKKTDKAKPLPLKSESSKKVLKFNKKL